MGAPSCRDHGVELYGAVKGDAVVDKTVAPNPLLALLSF
jgi:hypothetical protein